MKFAIETICLYHSIYTWLVFVNLIAARLGYAPPPEMRSLIIELKPLFWPSAMIYLARDFADPKLMAWQKALDLVGVLVSWYLLKRFSGDDDRWKKRRQKLAEKVTVVGGRLAVTPA